MKNNLLLIVLILVSCKNSNENLAPEIYLYSDEISLGVVNYSDTIRGSFFAYNTGTDTLYITKVGVSCGCTDGHSEKPYVLAGDSTKILFSYSPANDKDSVQKSLIIENNSAEPFKLVYIKAFVKR